jgi:hypothetical protein
MGANATVEHKARYQTVKHSFRRGNFADQQILTCSSSGASLVEVPLPRFSSIRQWYDTKRDWAPHYLGTIESTFDALCDSLVPN